MALLGFRQLLTKGVPQQEELNQIGENLGVNVTKMLQQAFGTSNTEVLQKAGVTGMQVGDAIVRAAAVVRRGTGQGCGTGGFPTLRTPITLSPARAVSGSWSG